MTSGRQKLRSPEIEVRPAIFWPMDSKPRILIAEDEAIIRLDLKEMLEEEGYEVVGEAADGEAAVKMTKDLKPDLVILDIVMPGVDGLKAARMIAEEQLSAVLVLTAYSQRDLVDQAARSGAMAYLVKPFDKAGLVPAIEVARARWDESQTLATESKDLAERLETRKLVERAKGRLMSESGIEEASAFRVIQKAAMERRISMKEVARRILEGEIDDLDSS
jgi:AmiR/NasT family two-component response regulator